MSWAGRPPSPPWVKCVREGRESATFARIDGKIPSSVTILKDQAPASFLR